MTHEPKMSMLLDDYIQGLMNDDEMHEFEKELETNPTMREELELLREIEEALTETDTNYLRMQIQAIMNNEPFQTEKLSARFNLADETNLDEFLSQMPLSPEISDNLEALPKIHVENHYRNDSEVVHQLYREQLKSAEPVDAEDESIFDEEWLEMQAAIQEKDVINLRESLKQIQINVHAHNYSVEEMESYIEGSMSQMQLELFEEELALNASLNNDLELLFELEEALSESDILDLRDAVQEVMSKETSSSHSLSEIESFIYGELDEGTRDNLANELFENEDLRAEINLIRELDEALAEKDVFQLRDTLREIASEITVTEEKSFISLSGNMSGVRRLAAVAAIFVMILGTSLIIKFMALPSSEIDLMSDSPTAITAFRSALPSVDSYLSQGFELYNSEDFDGALACFGKVLELDNSNPAALFYSGASHQNMHKYRNAVKDYALIIEHNDNIFIEQAEWYMGLCYLNLKENEKARAILEAIVSREGFYKQKAEVLLKKMKRKG